MSVVSGSLSVVCPVPVRFLSGSLSVGCQVPSLSFVRRSPLIPDMKEPPPSDVFRSHLSYREIDSYLVAGNERCPSPLTKVDQGR